MLVLVIILFVLVLYALLQIYRLKLGEDAQDKLNKELTERVIEHMDEIQEIKNSIYR